MAINVSFNGATIYKPGAYSEEQIDLSGGFPLSPTGIVAIFGESSSGIPGALVPNISSNVFSPNDMTQIIQQYGSGPLVDACQFLFAPGADGAIPGGAQAVYIYKTNASTQAQLVLGGNWGTVQSLNWGVSGNLITYQNALVPASPAMTSSSASFNLTSPPFSVSGGSIPIIGSANAPAQAAALAEYNTIAAMSPGTTESVLDGLTLTPGTFTSASSMSLSNGATLTLNGAGNYYFQIGSTLTCGTTSTIVLSGGATAANIYWQVGSSATLNGTTFQGNVIANQSITVGGGTVNGSLIALNAAITIATASSISAQSAPALGAAGSYGLLAASTITNSGSTTVNGSVGLNPGTSVTGFPPGMIIGGGGLTLIIRINGASPSLDNTFTLPTPAITVAALQAALNSAGNWSLGLPVGVSFVVSGSNAAAFLAISTTSANEFELISGTLLGSGVGTFNISPGLVTSETLEQALITITNYGTNVTESATVGGNVVMEIGRVGGVTPNVTITPTSIILTNNSTAEHTIPLSNFNTIGQLALFITTSTAGVWNAIAGSAQNGLLPPSAMDQVVALGAAATSSSDYPAQITNNASQVAAFFAASANVDLLQVAGQGVNGLPPAATEMYLTGGLLGGTNSAAITNALTQFTKFRVNAIVPLFSRNATADILDGLTDPSSTYVIDAIHQAVKTHLSLTATTKNKSERQGYLSMHDTYANCKTEIAAMADYRIQFMIQDIYQSSAQGVLQWYLPWAGACLLAGARGGSPVGLPMTFKYFNMSGIRQTSQPMTTPAANIVIGFDPDLNYDDAIINGVTFWEAPQTGGFRLVVDNTTYGANDNWVYNRANVLYAADVLAYDFRNQLENIYIGVKNTVTAAEIASTCEAILATYLAQGITVSTSDAKNGYKQLVVQINGNVVNISVTVKLVEGIDFILANITLQRATSTT